MGKTILESRCYEPNMEVVMTIRPHPKTYNPNSRQTGHTTQWKRETEAKFILDTLLENDCKFKGDVGEFINRFFPPCDDLLCNCKTGMNVSGVTATELFWLRDIYQRRRKLFDATSTRRHHDS